MINKNWEYGQKKKLAAKTGLSESFIKKVFNRDVGCGLETAWKIVKACEQMGISLTYLDLRCNDVTDNKYFNEVNHG